MSRYAADHPRGETGPANHCRKPIDFRTVLLPCRANWFSAAPTEKNLVRTLERLRESAACGEPAGFSPSSCGNVHDVCRMPPRRGKRAARRYGTKHCADAQAVVCADLLSYQPAPKSCDLVMLVYLQLPPDQRRIVLASAAGAVRAGGRLLVVAHDSENVARGYGGPQDPNVLYTAADVTADLATSGLIVDRAEQVVRVVTADEGRRQALDALVVASRPISR
jgi:hypothetical protein